MLTNVHRIATGHASVQSLQKKGEFPEINVTKKGKFPEINVTFDFFVSF